MNQAFYLEEALKTVGRKTLEEKQFQAMQEEAKQYASKPGRFTFVMVEVLLETEQGQRLIISDGDASCTCGSFYMNGECSHIIALEFLLKGLLTPKEGVYATSATSAVPVA